MEHEPRWLTDEFAADVVKLLRSFVISYNSNRKLSRKKVTRSLLPSLYLFAEEDRRTYVLELLSYLQKESILFLIEQDGELNYIQLVESAIPNLRCWLNMPELDAFSMNWHNAILNMPKNISHLHELLMNVTCLDVYNPSDILVSLSNLYDFLQSDLSLKFISWRQLSAHFFYGDSKYLDSAMRRSFLLVLFPTLEVKISDRPLQLSVFLVSDAEAVLFIENWDTFLELINHNNLDNKYHLVYTAGFKASARNIRQEKGVHFFYGGDFSCISQFEYAWFNSNIEGFEFYFWGDLDYSGLEILNKLSISFPNIKAWRRGYEKMLSSISLAGYGHTAEQTKKEKQRIPSDISCEYAQNILLPALDKTKLMLDQEWLLDI